MHTPLTTHQLSYYYTQIQQYIVLPNITLTKKYTLHSPPTPHPYPSHITKPSQNHSTITNYRIITHKYNNIITLPNIALPECPNLNRTILFGNTHPKLFVHTI